MLLRRRKRAKMDLVNADLRRRSVETPEASSWVTLPLNLVNQ
jgi:hypothetical protein